MPPALMHEARLRPTLSDCTKLVRASGNRDGGAWVPDGACEKLVLMHLMLGQTYHQPGWLEQMCYSSFSCAAGGGAPAGDGPGSVLPRRHRSAVPDAGEPFRIQRT